MLKRVSELPETVRNRRESFVAKDVREFARNQTYEIAEVTAEGKTAKQVILALRMYIKHHPDQCKGIKAAIRSGRAYLYREVAR